MANNVADAVIETLYNQGVRRVFGIPGDAINSLLEAIRNFPDMAFIQVKHEEAGAFAASAHAKVTGELGVCLGTAGGGAIHLLNGLYDAQLDHAPVLAITGQVETAELGMTAHQEINSERLFDDVAAYNQTIYSKDNAAMVVMNAIKASMSRGTVSHIALPQDIAQERNHEDLAFTQAFECSQGRVVPESKSIDKALELISQSHKKVILAGVGAQHVRDDVISLARTLHAPIVRTLKAKAIFPDEHELCLGGLGLLGTRPSVRALKEADLLIMIGTDFPYEEFYPENTKTIQINHDIEHIGRRYAADCSVHGDASEIVPLLVTRLSNASVDSRDGKFLSECQKHNHKWQASLEKQEIREGENIKPQWLARAIGEVADEQAIVLCDTGAVTSWVARHTQMRAKQTFTLSGNLATMAFSLSGAIGAQLAEPGRQVIAITGDGGFGMLMQEFITAVRYQLPITVVIFNNEKLGLIQLEQEALGNPDFETTIAQPDFAQYAELCGGRGWNVTRAEELVDTLKTAFNTSAPCVVNVMIDPNEIIIPPKIEFKQAVNFAKAKSKEVLSELSK